MTPPHDILTFWVEAGPRKWYAKDPAFDAEIRTLFEADHHSAARGEHDGWSVTPEGALALVILLDQVPRNLYRNSAHAFATDPKACAVARAAAARSWLSQVEPAMRQFLLLPFEHSETLADQDLGLALVVELGDADLVKWMRVHRDIIVRFGRFPHRNPMLGRVTTTEEQAFLNSGGFAG